MENQKLYTYIASPRNKEHSCQNQFNRSWQLAVIVRLRDSQTGKLPNARPKTEASFHWVNKQ